MKNSLCILSCKGETKICSKCGEEKGLSEFHTRKDSKDGLCARCRVCRNAAIKRWRLANPEKAVKKGRKYRAAHPERVKATRRKYQEGNPEKVKAACKNWRKNNPGKAKAATDKWIAENPERVRAFRKAWHAAHPDKVKAHNHTRRLLNGKISAQTIKHVYEDNIKMLDTLTCYLCMKPIPSGKDHLEHKTPLTRGGSPKYFNLAIACQSCNCSKKNKTVEEFLQERQRTA